MNRKNLSIAIIALQVCFFVGWYMAESQSFGKPIATIEVKPAPYDPRDLLSGQYMRMNYAFSRTTGRWNRETKQTEIPHWATGIKCQSTVKTDCSSHYGLEQTGDVWVTLTQGTDGLYNPTAASFNKPKTVAKNAVVIRGHGTQNASNILYGIEKYFVKEGTKEPPRNNTTVKLDVYESGKVRINTLLVKGKEWP